MYTNYRYCVNINMNLNISLPLYSEYGIRASKREKYNVKIHFLLTYEVSNILGIEMTYSFN